MEVPPHTSAQEHRNYFPGMMIHLGEGSVWQDILVEIHRRNPIEQTLLIPAVAEPQLIWQISGHVMCSDRDLGGEWSHHEVFPGDLFLTTTQEPYELKWKAISADPIIVMHVSVGLPLLARAVKETDGPNARIPMLREFSGVRDPILISILEILRQELCERKSASQLFVQGMAQSLATHLIRTYRDETNRATHRGTALPAYHLHRVLTIMNESLEERVSVGKLATAVGMSESHFSRLFKGNTGFSPSQFQIRLRISKAQNLLRTTTRPIIEIGMDVGYTSPSHFAHIFRKETGLSPHEYRERTLGGAVIEDFSRIATL